MKKLETSTQELNYSQNIMNVLCIMPTIFQKRFIVQELETRNMQDSQPIP